MRDLVRVEYCLETELVAGSSTILELQSDFFASFRGGYETRSAAGQSRMRLCKQKLTLLEFTARREFYRETAGDRQEWSMDEGDSQG